MPVEVRHHGRAGRDVVVLHGGPGAPGSASGLAKGLSHRFHVLEPLQRRAGTVPLTVERHVVDLAEVAPVCCAIVGWSWGAMLALSYAARFPERVSALGLVGIGTYCERDRAEYRRRMNERLGEDLRRRRDELHRALAAAVDEPTRDRLLAEEGALTTTAQSVALLEDEDDDALAPDAEGHHETWNDVLRLQVSGVEPASFARIHAPVLMVHGADDPHPGRATAETLRPHLPQLEYVELERCGHLPWRERFARERFFSLLEAWLSTHG